MRIHPRESGLKKVLAVKNASQLAAFLGVSQSAISQWWRVPQKHVRKIAEFTGVPLYEQRPDIWERPDVEAREPAIVGEWLETRTPDLVAA
jgi:DNA-binding transcriptional regulator YdaS (Cro superfamily)